MESNGAIKRDHGEVAVDISYLLNRVSQREKWHPGRRSGSNNAKWLPEKTLPRENVSFFRTCTISTLVQSPQKSTWVVSDPIAIAFYVQFTWQLVEISWFFPVSHSLRRKIDLTAIWGHQLTWIGSWIIIVFPGLLYLLNNSGVQQNIHHLSILQHNTNSQKSKWVFEVKSHWEKPIESFEDKTANCATVLLQMSRLSVAERGIFRNFRILKLAPTDRYV